MLTLNLKDNCRTKISGNSDKHWHQNGEYHRLDGPAIEYADGTKRWYKNGESQVPSPER